MKFQRSMWMAVPDAVPLERRTPVCQSKCANYAGTSLPRAVLSISEPLSADFAKHDNSSHLCRYYWPSSAEGETSWLGNYGSVDAYYPEEQPSETFPFLEVLLFQEAIRASFASPSRSSITCHESKAWGSIFDPFSACQRVFSDSACFRVKSLAVLGCRIWSLRVWNLRFPT